MEDSKVGAGSGVGEGGSSTSAHEAVARRAVAATAASNGRGRGCSVFKEPPPALGVDDQPEPGGAREGVCARTRPLRNLDAVGREAVPRTGRSAGRSLGRPAVARSGR